MGCVGQVGGPDFRVLPRCSTGKMLEAALLLSTVLTYAVLGAVGVGRPKRLPPVDPTKHHTLNFTSAGLRLGPPKREKVGGVVGDENACPGAAATNQCAESEGRREALGGATHTDADLGCSEAHGRTADGAEPPEDAAKVLCIFNCLITA